MVLLVMPCVTALSDAAAFPRVVVGPVERCELQKLAALFASLTGRFGRVAAGSAGGVSGSVHVTTIFGCSLQEFGNWRRCRVSSQEQSRSRSLFSGLHLYHPAGEHP